MPSITIRERDLTSAGNLDATTNAVYIPGYSNMGPVNTPILCETLQEFQSIFGSEPYKFRTAQSWPSTDFDNNSKPTGNFYEKGEFEKSYIMAAELLKLGLPIIYERVFSVNSPNNWYANVTLMDGDAQSIIANLKATSPGYASKLINYKINIVDVIIGKDDKQKDITSAYLVLSVGRSKNTKLGISEIPNIDTKFTFDPEVTALFPGIPTIQLGKTFTDNSGLVNMTVSNNDISKYKNNELSGALKFIDGLNEDTTDEFTITGMYSFFKNNSTDDGPQGFARLTDKGEYAIKFITSGAYPVFGYDDNSVAKKMLTIAADRGDCTALIDHTPNNDRKLISSNTTSMYYSLNSWAQVPAYSSLGEDIYTYGAMFTPYGIYDCNTVGKQVMLPASHGYLSALAVSIQTNGNWMAAAGVSRGAVPNLVSLCQNLTNAIADSYQPRDGIAINPITNIKPYGLTIWGNRTLKNNIKAGDLTATSFLNIRQLTNDVKRTVWVAAKTLTFEQNDDILWINFKSKIIPTLDQMISGRGLSRYDIKKQKTDKKATVKAKVILYAIEPVEDWDITIELADDSTVITG